MTGTVAADIKDSVTVKVFSHIAVQMGGCAEQQSAKKVGVELEGLHHIVVELLVEGGRMHADDRPVIQRGVRARLLEHEIEIGYGLVEVVLQGVGVQTEKEDAAGNEGEIGRPVHLVIDIDSGAQTVMVADQRDIGHVELAQDLALFDKFLRRSVIGKVAAMDHKIGFAASVDVCHHVGGLVIMSLSIAGDNDPQRVFALAQLSDLAGIAGVEVIRALELSIIRMDIKHITAR